MLYNDSAPRGGGTHSKNESYVWPRVCAHFFLGKAESFDPFIWRNFLFTILLFILIDIFIVLK